MTLSTAPTISLHLPTPPKLLNVTGAEPTGQIYTDQTGHFISPSITGNNYLMILYDYGSNHTFAQPMKNRQGPTIFKAYAILHK
jgi:hypothetical protein